MELAARAGVALFATGGVGGVHPPPAHYDVSADLTAFTRFPVAVVASGVKSILDLPATREHLETLGVCVVGFHTDDFPAFYLRCSPDAPPGAIRVDERFDDEAELAAFLRFELARANRGVLVCNPIPSEHEIDPADWKRWLTQAQARVTDAQSPGVPPARQATPALLAALHQISDGATLRANLALVESNAALAARLAVAMHTHPSP
jgi:pseudouridine-5'-phosphate glycosidase